MNVAATKLELAKRLLNTEDKDIINYIKAIFETREENWWDELPAPVKASVEKALEQSRKGQTISHTEMKKKYQKWLKR